MYRWNVSMESLVDYYRIVKTRKAPTRRGFKMFLVNYKIDEFIAEHIILNFYAATASVAVMLTYLRLRGPLTSKRTSPSAFANSVWSLPQPTFSPG